MAEAKNKKQKGIENKNDQTIDTILQPEKWDDYIGQRKIKKNLQVIIEAARRRGEATDHLLFYGQAGLGKTTLAKLVAREMGSSIKIISGPTVEKAGDLASVLSNLEANEILFIDEAHRLNRMIEEVLYPAMESRKLHIIIGKGPGARSISLDLPPFTLIAATTRVNMLSAPLRSRFGATFKLDYYDEHDIEAIVERSAKILGLGIDKEAIKILAKASRFTPRTANRILKRARDYIEVHGGDEVTKKTAHDTLEFLEIDTLGLESYDRLLLRTIVNKFGGGPVGISTIAAALSEDRDTIEDVYEPYLMRLGFLRRTPKGRVVESIALEHLGEDFTQKLI